MLDMLSITGDLIERTSSTARVQELVQLSLAPVFLLAAIGAMMNVMTSRLIWIADRIERIERRQAEDKAGREPEELPALEQRRVYAQWAVMLSTAAALTICIVVALLFVSAFIRPQLGTSTAIAWIVTMGFLFAGLLLFLLETRLATGSAHERRRRSRAILKRKSKSD